MVSFKKLALFFMALYAACSIVNADFCDDLKKLVDDGQVTRHAYGLIPEDQIARYEYDIAKHTHPEDPAGQLNPPAPSNKPHNLIEIPSITDSFKGINGTRSDPPFAGYMPSHCDWSTGTQEKGEGKLACVAYCKDHFRDQDECDGSRCVAFDGPVELFGPKKGQQKPGKCFCTCGCPNIESD